MNPFDGEYIINNVCTIEESFADIMKKSILLGCLRQVLSSSLAHGFYGGFDMTAKQVDAFNKVFSALPDDCRDSFREVAEYAISLGYMPAIKGVRKDYLDFSNNKWKRTILKVQAPTPKFPPYLAMKFYAVSTYSSYFQKAIDDRISTWKRLKYEAHCFCCGKCDGTEGYTVTLPEGKRGFLCGFGLLPLSPLENENIAEVKEALKLQDEFFRKQSFV